MLPRVLCLRAARDVRQDSRPGIYLAAIVRPNAKMILDLGQAKIQWLWRSFLKAERNISYY
ncbi:hypothetical protein PT7_0625 [Pusillimonas sp. T7-7]|nr:hypothetical protein PT7_0625 [Pusillimonas sp. T7-7]